MTYRLPIVELHHLGVQRRAILTVPPRFVFWDAKHLNKSVLAGAPLITPVVFPEDAVPHVMGALRRFVHAPAMFSPLNALEINPAMPYILAETIVHELVHYHQRARKGPLVYFTDYVAHYPGAVIDAIRKGGSWHDWHEMEAEARRIAREIINAHFFPDGVYLEARESEPIDAVLEIARRLK